MLYSIAEKILAVHRGARFLKVDLHIHTPASSDWNDKNKEAENQADKVQPEQIVNAALDSDLDLIAITDHNSVEWCEKVIQAASNKPLIVLPGFELTVNPGVHVLAIFEQDKNIQDLRDLLVSLGIKTENFGDVSIQTMDAITNPDNSVIRAIDKAGGLAIPAHIENGSGLIGRIGGGEAVRNFLENSGCRILEVTGDKPHEVIASFLKDDPRRFALLKNSDAHRFDAIGKRSTWIKLDPLLNRKNEPKYLDSLKQIGYEPISRIQFSDDDPSKKAQIIGMYTDGGLLRGQAICFNEELNCIIGGRGAGKSSLLDYLRFVLGDEPDATELRQKLRHRYAGLIGNSTTVYVLVEDPNDDLWLYERKFEFEEETHRGRPNTITITSSQASKHQVFIDRMETVKFGEGSELFSVDFYGQGEVHSITNQADTSRQLKLVDNFASHSIAQREMQVRDYNMGLDQIEQKLRNGYEEQRQLGEKIATLDELKDRIAQIEGSLSNNIFQAHQVWADANHWIKDIQSQLESQIDSISHDENVSINKQSFEIPDNEALEIFQNTQQAIVRGQVELNQLEQTRFIRAKEIKEETTKLMGDWVKSFNMQKAKYTEQLRNQGVANLEVLNTELAQKRLEHDNIVSIALPRRNTLVEDIKNLEKERGKLIRKLHETYKSIRECRQFAAEQMTKRLRNEVKIEIIDDLNTLRFVESLQKAVPPRTQKKHINMVVDNMSPQKLVEVIKLQKWEVFEELNISPDGIQKLASIGIEDLLELERVSCDDIASIQLKVGGAYKDLGDLSEGEKCTAVLSIILLDENRPLVIDQPEDELDHDFIMSNVVNTLANVKQRNDHFNINHQPQTGRQFIIATHNQNIPVLGNAELVIRMQKRSGTEQCEVVTAYALEHPETIQQVLSLEGGRPAFERRRQKYSVL